jgi:Tol biopolymer transport system component
MANPYGGMRKRAALLGILVVFALQPSVGGGQTPVPGCPERWPSWATDEPSNGYPTWSPNGRELAFASNRTGRSQIYVLRVADCTVRQVTSHPAGGWQPSWSPDGRRIAFVGNAEEDIWAVGADGTGLRRITRGERPDYEPSWSPNGRLIAFRRGIPPGSVYLVAPSGRGLRRLRAGSSPAWSPNGRFLAFVGADDATWVMRSDGRGARRVSARVGNGDQDVDWAPDGRRLVIGGSTARGPLSLFVKDVRGGPRRHLRASGNGYAPKWSPDGRWIAFMRPTSDTSEDVFLIRPDGRGLRRLTFAPGITT